METKLTRYRTPDGSTLDEEWWKRSTSTTTTDESPWVCLERTIQRLPVRQTTN